MSISEQKHIIKIQCFSLCPKSFPPANRFIIHNHANKYFAFDLINMNLEKMPKKRQMKVKQKLLERHVNDYYYMYEWQLWDVLSKHWSFFVSLHSNCLIISFVITIILYDKYCILHLICCELKHPIFILYRIWKVFPVCTIYISFH